MTKFDREIRRLARIMDVPADYEKRVNDTLRSLPDDGRKTKTSWPFKRMMQVAACILVAGLFLTLGAVSTNANIFTDFRQTIKDIFHIGAGEQPAELGVDSSEHQTEAKPDLMLELTETVIDGHSIYALVDITAPTSVDFTEKVKFDYFCFSRGEYYSTDHILTGATSCELLEVMPGRPNEAIYILSLSLDGMDTIEDGGMVNLFMKDLMIDPYGDERQMLVEGMWSLTFATEYTVSKEIKVTGTKDMSYPFLGGTAFVQSIDLTPLGLSVISRVPEATNEMLGLSDDRVEVSLHMLDGSKIVLQSREGGEDDLLDSSSISYEGEDGSIEMHSRFSFKTLLNTEQVLGISLEGVFISVMGNDR